MAIVETLTTIIQQQLAANQVLSGGLVLGALAAAAASARSIPGQIWDYCRRKLITSMELRDDTSAQIWFKVWLSHSGVLKHAKSVVIDVRSRNEDPGDDKKPMVLTLPAPGIHLLWYEGWPYWLHIVREKVEGHYGGYMHHYSLSTIGRGPEAMFRILDEGYELSRSKERDKVQIFANAHGGWRLMDSKHRRGPESLMLEDGVFEDLIADLEKFQADESWYQSMGIPWHRGYLLAGPPGSGKSSAVFVVASVLNKPIYSLNLSQAGLNDANLVELLANVPPQGLVLLEEIDTVFVGRAKNKDAGNESHVSFGGLLNALDGVAAQDGRIVFMTTNHVERLDPALVRPGRVDKQLTIDYASFEQALKLYEKFYGDPYKVDPGWRERRHFFRGFFGENKVPMAGLQGLFMTHRNDPAAAVEALPTLVKDPVVTTREEVNA